MKKWNTHPAVVRVYEERVRRAFDWLLAQALQASYVLFTVHSQPVDLDRNKVYVQQYEELANVTCAFLSLSADGETFFEIGNDLGVAFAISEFPSDSFDTVYALAEIVEQHIKDIVKT
ncbi:hypothetical protein [Solibacillus sp. CAU 1738]|uniref:hypothetical protein n=1 Tax=Solibacillus sp. CAU 1738 TaxID=3140363 RepID=UPI0032615E6B